MEKVVIKKSKIHGKGVYATTPISKGAKIFLFSKQEPYWHNEACNCKRCQYSIRIAQRKALTPEKDSYGWCLNHSCDANASVKGKYIIAIKKIKTNEEVTIDYSTNIADKDWTMQCTCKSKHCRKILRSIHYIPKTIFNRHKGYIPKFLERIYIKAR